MGLFIKIDTIKYKYNKLKNANTCTYLSKIILILEIKNLLISPEYTGKITLEDEKELNKMIEDLQERVLNNIK